MIHSALNGCTVLKRRSKAPFHFLKFSEQGFRQRNTLETVCVNNPSHIYKRSDPSAAIGLFITLATEVVKQY